MRPQFPADSNPPSSRLAYPAARSPLVGGERRDGGKSASPICLLPEVSVALPLAIALLRWGLLDTRLGVIFALLTMALPVAAWMLITTFSTIRICPRFSCRDCGRQKKEGRLITFGHGAWHVIGTGLTQSVVESAIGSEIEDIARKASRTGTFWGRAKVGEKSIEYRAHTLPNGDIHVGTYYPV